MFRSLQEQDQARPRFLVQRFCKIVELGLADVDEILTVTFTEKAAKEMKQRITSQFSPIV